MKIPPHFLTNSLLVVIICIDFAFSQSSTGAIQGSVTDQNGAVIPNATVTTTNSATGFTRSTITDKEGRYRFVNIPIGTYDLTTDAPNFSKFVRSGITLDSGQEAMVNVVLEAGKIHEAVTVNENAPMLNSTTAQVATRFDNRRLSELPISPNRSVYNVLPSVPGIGQPAPGQTSSVTGISYSAMGGRIRSNNFMIDGQDVNDTVFAGSGFALNNPDAFQEVLILTNQFKAEYGRNSGSVVNFVGRSGTNDHHGSLFWYHNNEYLNSCNNLDKAASFAPTGYCNRNAVTDDRKRAPKRSQNQIGFTFGGPLTLPWFGDGDNALIWKGTDRTFIFADYQRWSDRSQNSGARLTGAPTDAGRAVLRSVAAGRPQVQALLDFVPAGIANGNWARFSVDGESEQLVELGNFTSSSPFLFDDRQGSVRIDHRFNKNHLIYGRYRADTQRSTGSGQVTPPGNTLITSVNSAAATIVLNSIVTTKVTNEVRVAWSHFRSAGDAEDQRSKLIPSIAIPGLGLVGNPLARTAIGFPPTHPGSRRSHLYQFSDAVSYVKGDHNIKFGVELRRTATRIDVFTNARGQLTYARTGSQPIDDISNFINDFATAGSINLPLPGGSMTAFYRWNEVYLFAQDEWRLRNDLTFTFGVRYEYPGDSFGYLEEVNERVLAVNDNNPAFRSTPVPEADANNFMPRIGFNWNPRTGKKGLIGLITGGNKLVLRGGYARTYDASFMNVNENMFLSFPFAATQDVSGERAFERLRTTTAPNISRPNRIERLIVSEDFRAPAADQISFDVQRELARDLLLQVGYVRTRGTGLMQVVDGNPCRPGLDCRPPNFGRRVDPNREAVRLYTNSAASTYDAMQASLTKRLSNNFSAGLHYTWSTFIDDGSDIFAASATENALPQDPFNRRSSRARSSYDRPHRLTGNFVYELPFYVAQRQLSGRLLGGWQVNSIFTFQSGAPFSVSVGSAINPSCALCRPDLNTALDLSSMSISEIRAAGGANLFRSPGLKPGNAGRNILRADSLELVDIGVVKNTRLTESVRVQLRADMFNAFNRRNFGIPAASISDLGSTFLDQWATNGGNRRIVLAARLVF